MICCVRFVGLVRMRLVCEARATTLVYSHGTQVWWRCVEACAAAAAFPQGYVGRVRPFPYIKIFSYLIKALSLIYYRLILLYIGLAVMTKHVVSTESFV